MGVESKEIIFVKRQLHLLYSHFRVRKNFPEMENQ